MTTLKLLPGDLKRSEFARTEYVAAIASGTTIEQLEEPQFWSHVARDLRRTDKIVAIAEDGSYYAELIVTSTGVGFVKVRTLFHVPLEEASDEDGDGEREPLCRIKHLPGQKWSVQRLSDGMWIKKGFEDREAARAYMIQYERTISSVAA